MSQPADTNQSIPIPQAIAMAAQKIDAGELNPAEVILRQILEKQPENPHATHLLGIIAHRVGRSELALEMIGICLVAVTVKIQSTILIEMPVDLMF